MKTIAVFGATSEIAHAALRIWATQGADLRLVARDADKLDRVAGDLRTRGAASVKTHVADLSNARTVEQAVKWTFAAGPVDISLVAFGVMPSQEQADANLSQAEALLTINGTFNTLTAQLVALKLEKQGGGSLGVIGSVAGDRGRKYNYLYGSAKAMVATAVAGLQHRFAGTEVAITLIKPGPTRTALTATHNSAMKMANPEQVGSDIVKAIDAKTPVLYTPAKWRPIMTVIRLLPRRIFEKTNF